MAEPATSDGPSRHAVVTSTRWLVAVAVLAGLVLALFATATWARVVGPSVALVLVALMLLAASRRGVLVVDEEGYRVERRGQVALRVSWREVLRAYALPDERALYLDTGDRARNLLVPPRYGYAFRYDRQEALYARVERALGAKLHPVESFDAIPPPDEPPPPSTTPAAPGAPRLH